MPHEVTQATDLEIVLDTESQSHGMALDVEEQELRTAPVSVESQPDTKSGTE